MMGRIFTAVLLAAILAAAALVLVAGGSQAAPNATRAVMGARQGWCSPDGRFYRTVHSGWLPTVQCYYPPPVPKASR